MENELIKISNTNGKRAVNARELYMFLESKQEFSNWIKSRIKRCDLIENQDFEVFDNFIKNPDGGRPLTEYALTIEAAKEISMVENNNKGKQARRYFIECEKALKNKSAALSELEILQQSVNALVEQERKVKEIERRTAKIESKVANIEKMHDEATKQLFALPLSENKMPKKSLKARVNELVRSYATANQLGYQDVWHKVYKELYYAYHISINSYRKLHSKESKLDVAERNRLLDKIYTIISNMIRRSEEC